MENLYTCAYLLAGYGLNNAVFRYVVLKETDAEKRGVFDYVVSGGTKFNLVFILVLMLVVLAFPHSEEFPATRFLMPLMLIALPLRFLADTCSFLLRALFRNRAYGFAAVLTVVVVWGSKATGASLFDLVGAATSWPIAYCIVAIIFLQCFRKKGLPQYSNSRA